MLLGCLFKQPQLLTMPSYPLCKKDFSANKFHQVMYLGIVRLLNMGCQEITPIEMDNILQSHPTSAEIANDNNYMEFIETTKLLSIVENYEGYYNAVRKFALLRDLKDNGIDIKEFYDELQDENEQAAKLEKLSIQEILNAVELKGIKLRSKYDTKYVRTEMVAGEDTQALIDEFEKTPAFGAFLCSPYLTQL